MFKRIKMWSAFPILCEGKDANFNAVSVKQNEILKEVTILPKKKKKKPDNVFIENILH